MTNEESIAELKKGRPQQWDIHRDTKAFDEALDMAIQALEQQYSDDCISRQAVNKLQKYRYNCGEMAITCVSLRSINELPSVTHQQKIGRWIKHDTGHSIYYDCSRCSCIAPCTETADKWIWKLSNYCPDCGAKMR